MAYTSPTVRSTTDLISASIWNVDIVANILWLATDAPYVRVTHSADQSISNGTDTTLSFNTDRFDNSSMHDTSTNNERLIATVAGKYVIGGSADFETNGTGTRSAMIDKSSALGTYIAATSIPAVTSAFLPTRIPIASPFDSFALSEYARLRVFQDSGGALNIQKTNATSPEFWMYLIRI